MDSSFQVCPQTRNPHHSHIWLLKSLSFHHLKRLTVCISTSFLSCSPVFAPVCRLPDLVHLLFYLTTHALWRLSPSALIMVSLGLQQAVSTRKSVLFSTTSVLNIQQTANQEDKLASPLRHCLSSYIYPCP